MKHTPTPWEVIKFDGEIYIAAGRNISPTRVAVLEDRHVGLALPNAELNSARIVECVNAMDGIEDPKKLRETYEACKHLELDKYQKLKGFLLDLISDIHVGYELYPTTQKFRELENLIK